jgi:hypothetical protein
MRVSFPVSKNIQEPHIKIYEKHEVPKFHLAIFRIFPFLVSIPSFEWDCARMRFTQLQGARPLQAASVAAQLRMYVDLVQKDHFSISLVRRPRDGMVMEGLDMVGWFPIHPEIFFLGRLNETECINSPKIWHDCHDLGTCFFGCNFFLLMAQWPESRGLK